jgi:hypothetical protein
VHELSGGDWEIGYVMIDDEEEIKREFVLAFFNEFEEEIRYLDESHSAEREDEARLLCLVYIDSLANWLSHPHRESARNYCLTLISHGGNAQFGLILPYWLANALPWAKAPAGQAVAIRGAVESLPEHEAVTEAELLNSLGPTLTPDAQRWLEKEAWRGSIAHAVYKALRCAGMHQLGGSHGLSFSATWGGAESERIDFEPLHRALSQITRHARELSLRTNKWFGVEENS